MGWRAGCRPLPPLLPRALPGAAGPSGSSSPTSKSGSKRDLPPGRGALLTVMLKFLAGFAALLSAADCAWSLPPAPPAARFCCLALALASTAAAAAAALAAITSGGCSGRSPAWRSCGCHWMGARFRLPPGAAAGGAVAPSAGAAGSELSEAASAASGCLVTVGACYAEPAGLA